VTVSIATPPASTALTTVARLKSEMGITSTDYDTFLAVLVTQATEQVYAWAGRPLYRAKWTETRNGSGRTQITLARYPIASLDSITYGEDTITDAIVESSASGILFLGDAFTRAIDDTRWTFTYHAGYLLPGDDFDGTASVNGTTEAYESSALFTAAALLKAGDTIKASGFTNAANNGLKIVSTTAATTSAITVTQNLTTEASAASRMLRLSNLPGWIERACIDLCKLAFKARDRDPAVSDVRIGDASVSWSAVDSAPTLAIERQVRRLALSMV